MDKHGLETNIEDADKSMTSISELVKKTDNNTKITEVENKILRVTVLFTTAT